MVFGGNGIVFSNLYNFYFCYLNFISSNASVIFYNLSGNVNRTLLFERTSRFPGIWTNTILSHHTLAQTGSITQLQEIKILTASVIIDPSFSGYLLFYLL